MDNIIKYSFILALIPFATTLSVHKSDNRDHPVVIVIALDGFRSDYLIKFPATVTLNSLWKSGPRVPYMEPVFPTNTLPNLHSIATGLYPESHGVTDNSIYDQRLNKVLSGLSDSKNPDIWNYQADVLPIWIQNELHGEGRHSACIAWYGCNVPYGRRKLLPTYYSGYSSWENYVKATIKYITDKSKPANLVFIYYDQPDIVEHATGPNSIPTFAVVSIIDRNIKYLMNSLKENRILEKANVIILSDHGTAEIVTKPINLKWLVKSPLVDHFINSHSNFFVKAKPGKLNELYRKLKAESKIKKFEIRKREEMSGPPFFYSNSDRILDIILSAKIGSSFDNWPGGAHHGYSNLAPEMRSVFIATGPAFKKGGDHGPIKNVDVVHIIGNILGFNVQKNNGSFERVRDLFHSNNLLI